MGKIRRLCPWQVAKVQLYRVPKERRFALNSEAPVKHRAAVLLYDDDTVEVESEPLVGARQERSKFSRAVDLAIFIYGSCHRPRSRAWPRPHGATSTTGGSTATTAVICDLTTPGTGETA